LISHIDDWVKGEKTGEVQHKAGKMSAHSYAASKGKEAGRDKVLDEEDIIRIRNFEISCAQFDEDEEDGIVEKIIPNTFDGKRKIINKFYKENFEIMKDSHLTVLWIERDNERLRQLVKERNNPEGLQYLKSWKFFRSTNGKVRIVQVRKKDEDPKLEKKKIAYWGKQNNVTFTKKRIAREEKKKMQEKVDKLEIVRGFPKAIWQYCTFTPKEYERRKEELKIVGDCCEIYVPSLSMEERSEKFDGLYGAYCIQRDPHRLSKNIKYHV
jgi:hypothetical protein